MEGHILREDVSYRKIYLTGIRLVGEIVFREHMS